MMLQLDPTVVAVWRTPDSIQLGVDPQRLLLDGVATADERMLAALTTGTTASALAALGGGPGAADALLKRLGDLVLTASGGAAQQQRPRLAVRIRSHAREALLAQLQLLGIDQDVVEDPSAHGAPGLLITDHAVAPAEHRQWLRHDRAHLAVIFGECSATIGPVVRPGVTACLRCFDLYRLDRDPAWSAIATQLVSRDAPAAADAQLRAVALATAVSALCQDRGPATRYAIRIGVNGSVLRSQITPHPNCGCIGIPEGPRTRDAARNICIGS